MCLNLWLVNRPIHIGQHRGLFGQFVIWAILMFLWSDSHYGVLLVCFDFSQPQNGLLVLVFCEIFHNKPLWSCVRPAPSNTRAWLTIQAGSELLRAAFSFLISWRQNVLLRRGLMEQWKHTGLRANAAGSEHRARESYRLRVFQSHVYALYPNPLMPPCFCVHWGTFYTYLFVSI